MMEKKVFWHWLQAVALQGQAPVDAVVHLDVPFQTIIDRVKGKALLACDLNSTTPETRHMFNVRFKSV